MLVFFFTTFDCGSFNISSKTGDLVIVDDGADVEGRSFKLTDRVLAIGKAASPAGHIVAEKLQYAATQASIVEEPVSGF